MTTLPRFHLGVQFDPRPEDLAALRAWPAEAIFPDLVTVTSGWITAEFGGGRRFRVGDYVLMFLDRLMDAAADLEDGREHEVDLADGGGHLSVRVHGETVLTRMEEAGADEAEGQLTVNEFRRMVASAGKGWIHDLLAVNPKLEEHPEVRRLQQRVHSLRVGGPPP